MARASGPPNRLASASGVRVLAEVLSPRGRAVTGVARSSWAMVTEGGTMAPRLAHRISLVFGLVVLALAIVSSLQAAPPVCGNLKPGYAPIIAFELARSVSDLHAIFGSSPGACRSAIVARMDAINELDSFLFIPCYGLFLVFFFLGRTPKGRSLA